MLTARQNELLRFIHRRTREGGVAPSFDEMKAAMGFRSKAGVHRLIACLEERGFIRRLANHARGIEVLRLPEATVLQFPTKWEQVVTSPELQREVRLYASKENIKPETAINELIRQSLGLCG